MCVYVSLRVFTYYLHFLRLREKKLLDCCVSPPFVLDQSGRLAELEKKKTRYG